jgi:uncharacterized protein
MLTEKEFEVIKIFFSHKPVVRAFLFGSQARNAADEKSDVDILVELDYTQKIGLDYFAMEQELSRLLNRKVDLLSANSVSAYLLPRIEKDKVLVYARSAA